MYWQTFADFLAMGGYAGFVWSAFGIGAAVLIGIGVASLRRLQAAEADLAAARREAGRDA